MPTYIGRSGVSGAEEMNHQKQRGRTTNRAREVTPKKCYFMRSRYRGRSGLFLPKLTYNLSYKTLPPSPLPSSAVGYVRNSTSPPSAHTTLLVALLLPLIHLIHPSHHKKKGKEAKKKVEIAPSGGGGVVNKMEEKFSSSRGNWLFIH